MLVTANPAKTGSIVLPEQNQFKMHTAPNEFYLKLNPNELYLKLNFVVMFLGCPTTY